MKKALYTFIIIVLRFSICYGQYHLINYSVDEGLPSQETYFLHQDYDGYIWICTDRGVSRYNGYEFENFSTNDGLTYNTVFKIFEANNHDLWMICFDGSISIFSYKKKKFIPFWGNKELKKLKANSKWVANVGFIDNIVYLPISSIMGQGHIDSYILSFNSYDSTMNKISLGGDTTITFENIQNYIFRKKKYGNYFYTSKTIFRQNKNVKFDKELIQNSFEQLFVYDSSILSHTENQFTIFSKKDTINIEVPGRISGLLLDRDGNHWISTTNNGIYRIPSLEIEHINFNQFLPKEEKLNSISSLQNCILVGSSKGNYFNYNITSKKIVFLVKDSFGSSSYIYKLGDQLNSNYFEFKWKKGQFNIKSNLFKTFPNYRMQINSNLFVGYSQSRDILFARDKYFSHILDTIINRKTIVASEVSNNIFYFSTFDSIFTVDHSFKVKNVTSKYGLKNTTVRSIKSVNDSILILGTSGKGLILILDTFLIQINESLGLLSNMVNDIEIDKDNNIWCTTNRGLTKIYFNSIFNDKSKTVKVENFTHQNGLHSNNILKLHVKGNELWALTHNNLIRINVNLSTKKKQNIQLHIKELTQNNNSYKKNAIFNYDENNPTINFIGLSSFKPISKTFYLYTLSKNEEKNEWVETNNRSVTFNQLSPGSYTFKLKARTENGDVSETKSIQFSINPHWTNLWWVQFLFWFFLLLILGLIIRNRLLKRQEILTQKIHYEQLENKLKELELDVLRGQMNPHLIYNALNSAQSLMIQNDKLKATEFISRLSKLLRSSLEYSREEFITLEEELKFLSNYFEIESQRFPERFNYKMECEESLQEELITPLIIQPLCENAVKHAYDGSQVSILIKFTTLNKTYFQVEISDNGKGFDGTQKSNQRLKNSEKSSLGLTILKRRIDILREKFEKTSYQFNYLYPEKLKGTKITLVLPIIE